MAYPAAPRRSSAPSVDGRTRRLRSLGKIALLALSLALVSCLPARSPLATPVREGPATAAAVDRGASLYAARCQACHGDRNGQGGVGTAPPHNGDGHTWHHPDGQLRDVVLLGRPGQTSLMPAFQGTLSEAEVDDILAFIKTWWTDEQRATQADISRRYAAAAE